MSANVLSIWGEVIGIAAGGVILLVFAIFFSSYRTETRVLPGSAGRRTTPGEQKSREQEQEEQGGEVVSADGYIDSFAGVIEEAGGGPPLLVKIALIAIPLWWLLYIIINWSQYILSMRSFNF